MELNVSRKILFRLNFTLCVFRSQGDGKRERDERSVRLKTKQDIKKKGRIQKGGKERRGRKRRGGEGGQKER